MRLIYLVNAVLWFAQSWAWAYSRSWFFAAVAIAVGIGCAAFARQLDEWSYR